MVGQRGIEVQKLLHLQHLAGNIGIQFIVTFQFAFLVLTARVADAPGSATMSTTGWCPARCKKVSSMIWT